MRSIFPNFFFIGCARCGTTSIAAQLARHPDIFVPDVKEPKYITSLDNTFPHMGPGDAYVDGQVKKNLGEYLDLYKKSRGKKFLCDASSDALFFHETSSKRILELAGDVPILICLRNPVERTYSAYWNMIRDQREPLSLEEALVQEDFRRSENWDWMWAYRTASLYSEAVQTYLNLFSKVKIITF